MPAKARSKMISFRLTSEEYVRLRKAAEAAGVDNMSEVARSAVRRLISTPNVPLDEQVRTLRAKIESLGNEVDRVSRLVEQSKAARA